jgi:Cu/Ag efflux pump CusA
MAVEEPNIQIEVDLAKAQAAGIKPGDVRRAAAALLSGMEVGNLFEEQKVFDVIVLGVPETRHSLTSVRDLLIDTPDGGQVRLGDVADVRVAPSVSNIVHDGVFRYIDVGADVAGRDPNAVSAELAQAIDGVAFPLEYHAEVLGDYASRQADQQRLLGYTIAALVGIYLLLQAAFGSWRLAGFVLVALPAALSGGLLAALVDDRAISLGTLAGLVGVFLFTTRNAMMLTSGYTAAALEAGAPVTPVLAVSGARERIVPIVTTALATAVVLLPLLGPGPMLGGEIVRPAVVATLGGLVSAIVVSAFVLPALYPWFAPREQPAAERVPWSVEPAAGAAD